MKRPWLLLAFGAALVSAAPAEVKAQAQSFPSKPVTMIVPPLCPVLRPEADIVPAIFTFWTGTPSDLVAAPRTIMSRGSIAVKGLESHVTIARDRFGVPRIEARSAGERLLKEGADAPPLLGVPFTAKEAIAVSGMGIARRDQTERRTLAATPQARSHR